MGLPKSFRVRAPLRITLGGGGSDLDWYANKWGAFCLAATIDKYVYVQHGEENLPSGAVRLDTLTAVVTAAKNLIPDDDSFNATEYYTWSDITPGNGLGSSGALSVAVAMAWSICCQRYWVGRYCNLRNVANLATAIDSQLSNKTSGFQDTMVSVHGGVCLVTGDRQWPCAKPVPLASNTLKSLEAFRLFDTGARRTSSPSLLPLPLTAPTATTEDEAYMHDYVRRAHELYAALSQWGSFGSIGACFHEMNWVRRRHDKMPKTDAAISFDAAHMPYKTIGASGGGFILAGLGANANPSNATEVPYKIAQNGVEEVEVCPM